MPPCSYYGANTDKMNLKVDLKLLLGISSGNVLTAVEDSRRSSKQQKWIASLQNVPPEKHITDSWCVSKGELSYWDSGESVLLTNWGGKFFDQTKPVRFETYST